MPASNDTPERFLAKTKPQSNGCWIYDGYHGPDGRPVAGRIPGTKCTPERAYRRAYRLLIAPIPMDHHIHHTCNNAYCVNPEHLECLSSEDHHSLHHPRQNECQRGHSWQDENNYYTRPNGKRTCRVCDAQRHRDKRAAQRALASVM